MEERNYKVYMHTVPNGKKYVGITKQDVKKRWLCGRGYTGNSRFYAAIQKFGWDNIKHEVLFDNLTQEEAYKLEIEMIALNESNNPSFGYNQTAGGANECIGIADDPMPPFEEIYNNGFLLTLFNSLVDSCFGQTVTDKTTIVTYGERGEEKREVVETKRTIEPNIIAVNIILENYENEEKLKPLICALREIKKALDD